MIKLFKPESTSLWIAVNVCLIFGSPLAAQNHNPKIVDATIVFPLREVTDTYPRLLKHKTPTIRTLPDDFAYPVIPTAIADDFSSYLLELVNALNLPGVAFAVVQGDTLAVETTYGRRSLNSEAAIDKHTLFNIGPVTQAITSLLAAHLTTEHPHLFDRPANKIRPQFRLNDKHSQKNMTLRNLLNMTGGIPDYTDNILDPAWAKPEDIFAVIAQSPIIAQPGQVFNYSNVSVSSAGYLLAGIDNPDGEIYPSFTTLVKTRLFIPMGMTQATFSLDAAKTSQNYAAPHKKHQGKLKAVSRWEPTVNPFAPSIGLKANLNDMSQWLITEVQEGLTPNGQRVAPAFAVRERWKPTNLANKINSGMGWTHQVYKETVIITNTGSYDRHTCGVGFMPRYRTGFVVLVNTNSSGAAKLVQAMALGLTELLIEL